MFKNIIGSILVAISCFVARGEDNVLLWWFNDPVITDFDGSTYKADTLVGRGEAEGKQANMVRISSTDSDGNKVYLTMGSSELPSEFWGDGFGVPDWLNQNKAGPGWADIGGLHLDDTSLQFAMELGYAELGENGEYTTWIVMASASDSLQNMISGGHINASELSYEGNIPWSPGMTVPEPNSGLLALIGGLVLCLRRKTHV